jgi:hypothetical protein
MRNASYQREALRLENGWKKTGKQTGKIKKMARNKQTQLVLSIPKDFDASQRADLAEKVMEFIIDRSKKGYNVSGRDWAGKAGEYTEEYAKKKGVSPGGPVDLALSHDHAR